MKPNTLGKLVLLIVGIALLASGCETRQEVAYGNPPPTVMVGEPPPEVAITGPTSSPPPNSVVGLTVAPEDTYLYVWLPGVWVWRGGWVWEPGHWARRP